MDMKWLGPLSVVLSLAAVNPVQAQAQADPSQRTLTAGQAVNGRLTPTDPRLEDGTHYQIYSMAARAGDRLRITLRSSDFDAFLVFAAAVTADGCEDPCILDDDSAGDLDAMVRVTIPTDGTYQLMVNSADAGAVGAFTLVAELLPPAPQPVVRPIAIGRTQDGVLAEGDPELDDFSYYHLYRFEATAGQRLEITLRSEAFDAYLYLGTLVDDVWTELDSDDDGAGDTDSRLVIRVPETGALFLRVTSYSVEETGAYTLELRNLQP
jgi:hypothetical protein